MNKYKFLKKLLCLTAVFMLTLSAAGCKEKDTESNTSAFPSAPVNSEQTDALDPENIDLGTESGTAVKAEELVIKEGKANGVDVSKWQG